MDKLSKAQQAVVDKMREGWEMVINYHWDEYYLADWDNELRKDISLKTHLELLKLGVIKHKDAEGHLNVYRLTEQYKTEQKCQTLK